MTAAVMDERLFVDAVMARVADEPLPTPTRVLRAAVGSLDRSLAGGAIWTAWHLATGRAVVVRRGVRLRSAALLAALMLILAIGTTVAAAGAAVVVKTIIDRPAPTDSTSTGGDQAPANGGGIRVLPTAGPTDTPGFTPVGGAGNQPTPAPGADSDPSSSPDADSPDDGDNAGDGGSGQPGDGDQGDGSDGSGGDTTGGDTTGGDNSGGIDDSSGGVDEDSPEPSAAPEATDAAQATDAPEPTDSPDSGGSDDGSSGD